jgi:hypothetical protein
MNISTTVTRETIEQLCLFIDHRKKVNGKLIIKSKASGKDITFKVKSFEDKNSGDYIMLVGYETKYNTFINAAKCINGKCSLLAKFKDSDAIHVHSALWLAKVLSTHTIDALFTKAEVHHTGSCIKCSRELTDLASAQRGMGPVCSHRKFN